LGRTPLHCCAMSIVLRGPLKFLICPLTWLLAAAWGRTRLIEHTLMATLCRYAANMFVTVLSKLDCLAERRRVQRINPPAKQHERELDWDMALLLSPPAFLLVDVLTPWFQEDTIIPLELNSILSMVLGHYLVVEPLYYAYHRYLHTPNAYRLSHSHHHSSTVTEAISGTSHPIPELIGYLANFSLAFLVPCWCGCFAYELVYIYFVWFDIMNCIGHCNFEAIPPCLQWGPLKYLVYTGSYHSLHHTKFKFNYCLFCPVWDYLFGTVHPTTDALYAKVLSQQPRKLDVVFLGHGHTLASMLHLPWLSPYLASHEHRMRWWMVPLRPLLALWVLFCRYCLRVASVQRYLYRGTECATWCLPVTGHFYLMKSHQQWIADKIVEAVLEADAAGIRYFGLGALNKAQWINHGGEDVVKRLPPTCKVKVVHGNTLTTAAVYEALLRHTSTTDKVFMTGSTSKIGRALCLLLARRGNAVRMLSSCELRCNEIRSEAGQGAGMLRQVRSFTESDGCRVWVIGKKMSEAEILEHIPVGSVVVDFAVPHIPQHIASRFFYVNGAALSYSSGDCDLTFVHDVPGTVPACLAATIVHAREDLGQHECGEVNVEEVPGWWEKATKHGFRLECLEKKAKDPSTKLGQADLVKEGLRPIRPRVAEAASQMCE